MWPPQRRPSNLNLSKLSAENQDAKKGRFVPRVEFGRRTECTGRPVPRHRPLLRQRTMQERSGLQLVCKRARRPEHVEPVSREHNSQDFER